MHHMQQMEINIMKTFMITMLAVTQMCLGAVTQTFEAGEDTSHWGSVGWSVLDDNTTTFLTTNTGGYGAGQSDGHQHYKRKFRKNTAGVDVTQDYSISMWLKFDIPQSHHNFEFMAYDGSHGHERAAVVRIDNNLQWQVGQRDSTWTNVGMSANGSSIYRVLFNIDVSDKTYDVTIAEYANNQQLVNTVTSTDNTSSQNVFQNKNNGQLGFFLQNQDNPNFKVDNINITQGVQAIPEPSTALLFALFGGACILRRRK